MLLALAVLPRAVGTPLPTDIARLLLALALTLAWVLSVTAPVYAQEGLSRGPRPEAPLIGGGNGGWPASDDRGAPQGPAYARGAPWQASPGSGVDQAELAPLVAADASGLPVELWRGLDVTELEALLAPLDLPPRSLALHQLWRRMLLASAPPPGGVKDAEHLHALRLEALYRSGLLEDMERVAQEGAHAGPLVRALMARRDIGLLRRESGCEAIRALAQPRSGLPGRLKGEMQLLVGYCAAASGDAPTAALAAALAREEGFDAELPLAVLEAVAAGQKPRIDPPRRVLLIDYRFLELIGRVDGLALLDRAEPALLVALAKPASNGDPRLELAAAEAAYDRHALAPEAMAEVYRRHAQPEAAARGEHDEASKRALFFRAMELAPTPRERVRYMRALLDRAPADARTSLARLIAPQLARLEPTPELAPFAETAVEIALAAGDFAAARRWAEIGPAHWRALIEIADAERRGGFLAGLGPVADLAQAGRLSGESLERLASVLDALDVDVPIPLWEAASRVPQSVAGYLPQTGVLAELAQAAKRAEAGRTILLLLRVLGPNGAQGAHVLALGDGLRALRRIGLESDARRLALEALLPIWPRAVH